MNIALLVVMYYNPAMYRLKKKLRCPLAVSEMLTSGHADTDFLKGLGQLHFRNVDKT